MYVVDNHSNVFLIVMWIFQRDNTSNHHQLVQDDTILGQCNPSLHQLQIDIFPAISHCNNHPASIAEAPKLACFI